MQIGDKVRYSVKFLRSIACYAGPMACATGTVTALQPFSGKHALVSVDWHGEDLPQRILDVNLTVKGSPKARMESIQ
jgi:hypothetical protein